MTGVRVETAIFLSGDQESQPVYIGAGRLVALLLPSQWSSETSFDGSPDGVTFEPVYESSGGAELIVVTAAGRFVTLANPLAGVPWVVVKTNLGLTNVVREVKLVIQTLPT